MFFINRVLSFKIYDSYSLKDKRSTVKSLIKRIHNRYNVSIAEVGEQDMLNVSKIGIAITSSSQLIAQQTLDAVIEEIEARYEIEIFDIQEH
ncbi:DUF503 domain-containing protein [Jeotgalibaca porci]|jgi:uncharacterized protein YlxP (DUF503 family)|uniref:DUF503 domain-containing protein n=1 Tax=Jeotgalibaca porci TaxID=1868793 RepID=A0A6G7WGV5_9LACT|nr:DUF503 domain-containing protein [Jeotgalibaca porci]NLB99369.1 DUF503 domain-containing protein [Lactobacillales bacterium]QIK51484.1 DUF503 domain-containing protein [Jeotgalibaca porci]